MINFASDESNITVILATNRTGKSTILNAFTWALYNSFTPAFKNPTKLVNRRAIAEVNVEDEIKCIVEIKFSHTNKTYKVTKSQTVIKKDNEDYELVEEDTDMFYEPGNGNWTELDNPIEEINSILPKDLHNYFFFDGERMEKMVDGQRQRKDEIEKAAEKLLKLDVIKRAVDHLGNAKRHFETELQESGNPDIKKFIEEKDIKNKEKKKFTKRNVEIDSELSKCTNLIKQIEDKLKENQGTKEAQEKRDKLKKELEEKLEPALENIKSDIKKLISEQGYSFFIEDLLDDCDKKIEAMRKAGELPVGIKKQFVDDLLQEKKCICTTSLEEGTPERDHVIAWKSKAGLEDVEQRAISVGASIKLIKNNVITSLSNLNELKRKKTLVINNIAKIERELDEISEQLKGVEQIQMATLENQRVKHVNNSADMTDEWNKNEGSIRQLDKDIKAIEEQIQLVQVGQTRYKLIQERLNISKETIKVLSEMLVNYQNVFKARLEERMQHSFKEITDSLHYPVIDEKFNVNLMVDTGSTSASSGRSTGEGQVLSITFILGLIEETRRHIIEGVNEEENTVFPLVLDSPFGALGEIFGEGITRYMSTVADQTIILVSETQWRPEVENTLMPFNPKQYYLTYHNPGASRPLVKIYGGKDVELQLISDKHEWCEIREV
jgi:DNA sulfur modification protein DndD